MRPEVREIPVLSEAERHKFLLERSQQRFGMQPVALSAPCKHRVVLHPGCDFRAGPRCWRGHQARKSPAGCSTAGLLQGTGCCFQVEGFYGVHGLFFLSPPVEADDKFTFQAPRSAMSPCALTSSANQQQPKDLLE